ncbi:hypothetical protein [Streptomyces flavidovirens]
MTSFAVRRFIDRGLLTALSPNPDGSLLHPGQVADICPRKDLAELVDTDTPLGPDQAAARPSVRHTEFDHMVASAGSGRPCQSRTASAPLHHGVGRRGSRRAPEADWEQLRAIEKGWRSPLAACGPPA